MSGSIHVPDRFQLFVLSLASDHTSTHIVTNETKRSSWLVYLPLSAYVATGWPLSFPRGSGLLHTPKQARPLHVSCSIVYCVSSTPSIERAVSAAIDARCSVQLDRCRVAPPVLMPSLEATLPIAASSSDSGLAKNNAFALNASYVCPEPVLANCSLLYVNVYGKSSNEVVSAP